MLPTEVLLMIFGQLKDQQLLVSLTEVCTRFNAIISPNITCLTLDKEICLTPAAVHIQRSYKEIVIKSSFKKEEIENVLESSKSSARVLVIDSCLMNQKTLVWLLNYLENIEELKCFRLVVESQDSFLENLSLPKLPSLKVLDLDRCSVKVVKILANVTSVEQISVYSIGGGAHESLKKFLCSQKELKMIE